MDLQRIVERMARFPGALAAQLDGLPDDDLRWRPADGGWSLLEIAGHLLEEEQRDFRPRLERTLAEPQIDWDPIDPEGWVTEHAYNQADPDAVFADFAAERDRSLAWLRGLGSPDWSRAFSHPALGELTAGELMASWAVHDVLHLRQVCRRLYDLSLRDAAGHGADYAGPW